MMISFLQKNGVVFLCSGLFFSVVVKAATNLLQAGDGTPWDDLKALLSDPNLLTESDVSTWKTQCLDPFINADPFGGDSAVVSNYLLYNQSSGLCLDHVGCAYENCFWPFIPPGTSPFPPNTSPFVLYDDFNTSSLHTEKLNLPAMVLHPNYVSDIVHAIEFCKQHKVGISVKVAGHSYFGSSTGRGTLLIKMSTNYPKYGIEGSLTECSTNNNNEIIDENDAFAIACELAIARGKKAVLRVGGGEMFDEAYRAISYEWNENNNNKYHLVGGGAGTVGAAGGWVASGGLSGTTGMRMYGVGIDQVLHIEMILPSGTHVRFGPTQWMMIEEDNNNNEYPKTLQVTGYCNQKPHEVNETLWVWENCSESINFEDLWFACRGGGGGTFGIVTSLYYQLHDYPGILQIVSNDPSVLPPSTNWDEMTAPPLGNAFVSFILKFLYKPEDLNVTDTESQGCNSAMTANLNPLAGGVFFCYNNSGTVMVNKWNEFLMDQDLLESFRLAGITDEVINAFPDLLTVSNEVSSYADAIVSDGSNQPGVPIGRLADAPRADLIPVLGSFPNYVDSQHTHFPLDILQANMEELVPILSIDALLYPNNGVIYAMGGVIPFSSDAMNSLSPTRRNAAFLKSVPDKTLRDQYYNYFFSNANFSGPFPGSSCHNHALVYEMGPLRTNWTQTCPQEWTQEEREEKCISQNVAAWGTENLERLEMIKRVIDPDSIFICSAGVGYSYKATPDPSNRNPGTPSPVSTSSTSAPATMKPMSSDSSSLLNNIGTLLLLSLAVAVIAFFFVNN